MKKVTCEIFRFNPDTDSHFTYQTYDIPYYETMNVQQILEYIYENIDSSLSFRRFYCFKGVCQSCLMKINGQIKRACSTTVQPGEKIRLEPIPDRPVIKDLVVDYGRKINRIEGNYLVTYGVSLKRK